MKRPAPESIRLAKRPTPDLCQCGRPDHQDLIRQLGKALGHDLGAMPLTPEQVWNDLLDEVEHLREMTPPPVLSPTGFNMAEVAMEGASEEQRKQLEVYASCPLCPLITYSLIGACASVGIEHGKSTGDRLLFYMETQHAKHSGEVTDPQGDPAR